ncbi:transforming growth factor-beta-induced protein ig-h3-like [Macrosteles quadrilineatus]|uniref:transforming growth factor-beta-induced protein ig-h3-like n=1 Tax=Macrosteles quadrilineatus TaxID=74068 RepID=UPI0023E318E5|nr:transforming growth factor-beta-induced protein ig-h3-like [Macrosteles quadrilineatus]XP_054284545.1 transforming growth factor-beta-induced protein ig-h3-like [Macrosteles quadrilineatus]
MLLLALCVFMVSSTRATQLPNTTGIDGELTAKLAVDHFFSLWLVFNNDDVTMSDKPFTILAPRNNASLHIPSEKLKSQPEAVKKLLLDHVVLGQRLDLDIGADLSFTTLGGRTVTVRAKHGSLIANGARVTNPKVDVSNGRLIILENYLFPEDLTEDHSFLQDMTEVLSFLQGGVRVFQHLLARSNVTKLLKQDEFYTVFVPTDRAFQRWHPIDWGFYPFSVPDFTENVLTNHFVPQNIRQEQIKDGQTFKTLGGQEIVFHKKGAGLTVNGADVVKGDTPVARGNIMFVSEVLFVNETVVQRLHQKHKDKETPPLLAFPWFGAQFLSHAFLALERTPHFSHVTRFLNMADLAPHISGAGYSFFVPTDAAFEKQGLKFAPDNFLSTGDGLQVLLSHFVKDRLYDKDLTNNATFQSLGGKTLRVQRIEDGSVTVEGAKIVQSEVFVYNLGTMFFIDKVLFADQLPEVEVSQTTTDKDNSEWAEGTEPATNPDVLLQDATTTEQEVVSTILP